MHRPCFDNNYYNKTISVPPFVYHLLRNIKSRGITAIEDDVINELETVIKQKYSNLLDENSTPLINELVSKALNVSI